MHRPVISSRTFFQLLGLSIGLILSFWIANLDVKPKYLSIHLQGETQQEQELNVFFMKTGKTEPFPTQRTVRDPNTKKTHYFAFPKHFSSEYILIDLGTVPSKWTIHSLGIYVHFFAFDIIAYEWPLSAVAQVTSGSRQIKTHLQNDNSLTVSTLKEPGHIYFPLDYTKLKSTPELIVAKIFSIVCVLGIFSLIFSRYFWQLFATRKSDAKKHEQNFREIWKNDKLWMVLGSLLLLIVLVILRYPTIITPNLYIEDTMELSDSIAGGVSLFDLETYKYYRGYPVFLSKLLASAASFFPLSWQPHLYIGFGLFFTCLCMVVMAYSGLFVTRFILLIAPLTLCFSSFTIPELQLTLTGTMFSSIALLMGLVIRPAPSTNKRLLLYLVLVIILAFSGPYSAQLLPLALGVLLFNSSGKKTFILITIIFLVIAYILSSSAGMVQLSNIFDPSTRVAFFNTLTRYIFLLEVFPRANYKFGLAIILVVTMLMVAFRHDRLYIKHSLIFLAVSVAAIVTYFISFKYGQYQGEILPSHTIISQFCWVIFVLLSADKLLRSLNVGVVKWLVSLIFLVLFCVILTKREILTSHGFTFHKNKSPLTFILAVEQARKLELKDNEFIQLWHINARNSITSIQVGSSAPDAISVDASRLPIGILPYFLPISLDRKKNMMLKLDINKNMVRYSNGKNKNLP